MENELLQLETRRRIYATVLRDSGASAREIQRAAGLGWGEIAYHLETLVHGGVLRRERGPRRDFYFPAELQWNERKALSALKGTTPRRILVLLLAQPLQTFAGITSDLGVSKSTTSFHLSRLLQSGLIESVRIENVRRYRVTRPEQVARLLKTYRANFRDELAGRFAEVWTAILSE